MKSRHPKINAEVLAKKSRYPALDSYVDIIAQSSVFNNLSDDAIKLWEECVIMLKSTGDATWLPASLLQHFKSVRNLRTRCKNSKLELYYDRNPYALCSFQLYSNGICILKNYVTRKEIRQLKQMIADKLNQSSNAMQIDLTVDVDLQEKSTENNQVNNNSANITTDTPHAPYITDLYIADPYTEIASVKNQLLQTSLTILDQIVARCLSNQASGSECQKILCDAFTDELCTVLGWTICHYQDNQMLTVTDQTGNTLFYYNYVNYDKHEIAYSNNASIQQTHQPLTSFSLFQSQADSTTQSQAIVPSSSENESLENVDDMMDLFFRQEHTEGPVENPQPVVTQPQETDEEWIESLWASSSPAKPPISEEVSLSLLPLDDEDTDDHIASPRKKRP